MPDQSLSLGVIFTGRIDAKLAKAMADLKEFGRTTGLGAVADKAKQAAAGTSKMKDDTKVIGKQIGSVAKGFDRIAAAFKVVIAYGLAGSAIFRLITAFKSGAKAIIDFDQALKNLQAIIGATDAEISLLGEEILKVAANTRYSAEEVSQAMILLGQSGLTAAESLDAIGSVANLATGTLSDMKTTSDLLTTAIRAFGIDSSRSAEIADIFASAVNKSKLTIDKLRTAFNYVAPVAAKAGVSLQEVTAAMMVLANAGIRASTIGTGLRQVFARLVAPSSKLREQYIALGIDLEKLNPATNSLATIIGRLSLIVPDAQRAFELFGLRGAPAVAALTKAGTEGFMKMYKELQRVGVAQQMAEKQMEGLGVQAKQLADKLGVLAIAIGEAGFAGGLNILLQVLRAFVDLLIEAVKNPLAQFILTMTQLIALMGLLKLTIAGVTYGLRQMFLALIAFSLGQTIADVRILVAEIGLFNTALRALTKEATYVTLATTKMGKVWAGLMAFFRTHPLFAYATAFATVIIFMWQFVKASAKVSEELQKQWISADKTQRKLEGYIKTLEENKGRQVEYQGTLERLRQEFEELGPAIDEAKGQIDGVTAAIKKLAKEQEDLKTDAIVQQLDLVVRKAQEIGGVSITELLERGRLSTPGYAASPEELMVFDYEATKLSLEEVRSHLVKLQHTFDDYGFTINTTDKVLEAFLRSHGMMAEDLTDVIYVFRLLISEHHEMKASLESLGKTFRAMPEFFDRLYDQLDPKQLGDFLTAYSSAQSEIERTTKSLDELMTELAEAGSERWKNALTQLKVTAAQETYVLTKTIGKFAEIKGKDVESDRAIYEAKMKLFEMWIDEQEKNLERQTAYLKKNIEERRDALSKVPEFDIESEDLVDPKLTGEILALNEQEKKALWELSEINRARILAIRAFMRALLIEGRGALLKSERDFYKDLLALREQMEQDEYVKLDLWYERRSRMIVDLTKKAIDQAGSNQAKAKKAMEEGLKASHQLDANYWTKKFELDYKYFKKELDIFSSQQEAKALQRSMDMSDEIEATKYLRERTLELDLDALHQEVEQRKKAYDESKTLDDRYREVKLDAEDKYWKAFLTLVKAQHNLWLLKNEELYRKMAKYSDEWYNREKKKLEEAGASWREFHQLRIEMLERGSEAGEVEVGTMEDWEGAGRGFEAAWKRIQLNMKTESQRVADFLVGLYDQTSATMGDLIYDGLKNGFDNARDIFQDFVDSLLRMWSDMVAKMVMKWLATGIASMFGPSGGSTASGGGMDTMDLEGRHRGGTGGESLGGRRRILPRFHDGGLAQNEVLAILKKEEVVFTPGQLKALSSAMAKGQGSSLAINVPITIDDPQRQKRLISDLRTEMEDAARKVLRRQLQ